MSEPQEREYELLLTGRAIATQLGSDGEDACRRYVAEHPEATVIAWQDAPTFAVADRCRWCRRPMERPLPTENGGLCNPCFFGGTIAAIPISAGEQRQRVVRR